MYIIILLAQILVNTFKLSRKKYYFFFYSLNHIFMFTLKTLILLNTRIIVIMKKTSSIFLPVVYLHDITVHVFLLTHHISVHHLVL